MVEITMSDVRLAAGEGKLSAHDVLAACNAVLRTRQGGADPTSAPVNPGWQPISAAPKDGTTVLVWRPSEGEHYPAHVGVDFWSNKSWYRSRRHQQPTHWMPLPPAPLA